ncbi:BQ2448_8080 [Microbotryum intermedium]|uniref:BQ2448_8080 protein n=1 Tax=Microbotryum intermedium TaxID=269621 RepID=A0A238FQG4_9BASI|nr:BQ2448_8080 [Microbotryum intermedium]
MAYPNYYDPHSSSDPYDAPQTAYNAPQPYSDQHHDHADSTFAEACYIGRDQAIPGGRAHHDADSSPTTYPPRGAAANTNLANGGDDVYEYEKGLNPVTRGSIAAQMAAEGQIPKKEGLRQWRTDEHKGTFTRGGIGKASCRVVCCIILMFIIILVGVVTSFLLWTRPPAVSFNGIELPTNGQEVTVTGDGFLIDFKLKIGVLNPNFFGVTFDRIQADAYHPLKPSTAFGGGTLDGVEIKKDSNTTIRFPFEVNYTTAYDSNLVVLRDIATRCGFYDTSSPISDTDIMVNYKIKLAFKVIGIKISPSFSSSTSLACPLTQSDISGLLSELGESSKRSNMTEDTEPDVEAKTRRSVFTQDTQTDVETNTR